jgi:hypothetical protein
MEPHLMSHNERTAGDRDLRLENLAAELTGAAYPLVLQPEMKKAWIEVELVLWRVLAETVRAWARRRRLAAPGVSEAWRVGLLGAATTSALSVALHSGVDGPRPDLEFGLYQALRWVIRTSSDVN